MSFGLTSPYTGMTTMQLCLNCNLARATTLPELQP
jgi:hypothetical protein